MLRPPAADIVSVHPGKGSLIEPDMIAGLRRTTGMFAGLLFLSVLSAIDLVNVYVFGQGPRMFLSCSSC